MNTYDIIGDIHGCEKEMDRLLTTLGYRQEHHASRLVHPEQRMPVFLGDLTDRGPSSVNVLRKVISWVMVGDALYCPGNHCNKLYRYFLGNKVQITHGLETTVAELKELPSEKFTELQQTFITLYEQAPLYHVLNDHKLVVAHAGIREDMIGKKSNSVKTFVLYGDITGQTHADGRPVRRDWAQNYNGEAFVVYGHTPVKEPRRLKNTLNIDTGCVFGGKLTALQWPEMNTLSVPSTQPYVAEKFH
ncbi:bis(5'-nucleosyl)-tetraphosphatase PrpE [Salipaludibacillus agaradhaerens]|uniref:bis(5'-nucleosyl)-tetraphosphatase PrpE n=1 Tax=Salipaludibacillus agaradhaerens TaxID=76935 RepID=UPI0009986FB7|nr:bis(5'-nucleosyl)-tetraphosphatase PrpE [Salipaludibacillus agaradhaerens]